MRDHTWSLGLLLALQGCAYQQAMKHGETASLAQDWDRAYEAYRFANELKPGKADAAVAKALAAAVEVELVAAETAIGARDFAKADGHLREAERLDPAHARLQAVRETARKAALDEVERRVATDEPLRDTYAFAVLVGRLYPTEPAVEDAIVALRGRVEDEVRGLVKAEKYPEARALARAITAVEPEQATRGVQLDGAVTDAWVAELVDDAKGAERALPGLAAVYYARAFEVGGREEHKAAAAKAMQAAAPDAALSVYVDSQGDGGRHWRLRKAVRTSLETTPGVEAGWSTSWDLKVLVAGNGERCKESKETKPLEKEYVAGTRQVPNPAFVEVSGKLEEAESERDAAKAAASEAQASLESVQAELATLQAARDEKQRVHDEAVMVRGETEGRLTIARARETELANSGAPAAEVEAQKQLVAEWAAKMAKDDVAIVAAKKELDAAEAKFAPVKAKAEQQAAVVKEAEARLAEADKKAADLRIAKRDTPPELTEDVVKTAEYAETTWTFACDAPATVYFAPKWKTELERKQRVAAATQVTDLSRTGHEGAKIEADPKQYPKTQKDMVGELDATSHQAIAAAVEAFVADSFQRKVEGAFASSNAGTATNTLITVYAGAPERLDAAARTRLVEHLKAHYGLEDPALLGVVVPPPTTAQAAGAQAPAEGAEATGASGAQAEGAPAEAPGAGAAASASNATN